MCERDAKNCDITSLIIPAIAIYFCLSKPINPSRVAWKRNGIDQSVFDAKGSTSDGQRLQFAAAAEIPSRISKSAENAFARKQGNVSLAKKAWLSN